MTTINKTEDKKGRKQKSNNESKSYLQQSKRRQAVSTQTQTRQELASLSNKRGIKSSKKRRGKFWALAPYVYEKGGKTSRGKGERVYVAIIARIKTECSFVHFSPGHLRYSY